MGVENLTLKQLREKYKDVLESEGVKRLIELKRWGETASFGDQSAEANRYAMNDEAYSQRCKKTLPYLLKKLN